MTSMEEYLTSVAPAERTMLAHIRQIVYRVAPEVTEGISYAMPAYLYRGKALLSVMVRKDFLSAYPFSGKVTEKLRELLRDYECTSGSIHFTLDHPLSDSLIEEIIRCRMAEIA